MSEIQNIAMGERIRMIREKIGWTQEFLAEKIDISSVHLSRIENGKVTPGVDIFYINYTRRSENEVRVYNMLQGYWR